MSSGEQPASAEPSSIADVQKRLRAFCADRAWQPFHTPKNLAMALTVEAGELMEIFQWLTPQEAANVMSSPQQAQAVCDELADVFLYLSRLADILDVDLLAAAEQKIHKNAQKYPADEVRGRADKR